MEREITLRDYGRVAWSGRILILAVTVVAVIIGLLLSFAKPTTYRTSAEVFLGQATSSNGVPVATPLTNPITATSILGGDDLVDVVAAKLGLSTDRVRASATFSVQRVAGSASTNQPVVATVNVADRSKANAKAIANAYADAIYAKAATLYAPQERLYGQRLAGLQAREGVLERDADRARQAIRAASAERAFNLQLELSDIQTELAQVRQDLIDHGLDQAKSQQIEAPAIVTRAGTPSSSAGARNRLGLAVFAGVIGLIFGLIATFVWKGSPDVRAPSEAS